MAQWSDAALFPLEEVGVQAQIPAWLLPLLLLLLSLYFYPLPFYCLFSPLTMLA